MTNEKSFEPTLGCNLVPDDTRNFPYHVIEEIGAEAEQVPDFQLHMPPSYQGNKPSCVGHSTGKAKSKQESNERGEIIDLNKMMLYSFCKREQGYSGWGTNVPLALKMLMTYGIPLDTTIPEDVTLPESEYIRACEKMTEANYLEASQFKAQSYWYIYAGDWERIIRTTYTEKIPLITTMMWYKVHNRTEADGRLPLPSGEQAGGHAFVISGKETVGEREKIWFDNSFGKNWGKNGRFYIWKDELSKYGLGTFFVIVDIPREVADILVKYNNKLIKNDGDPRVYFVWKKQITWIEDPEIFEFLMNKAWGNWSEILTIPETIKGTKKFNFTDLI